jgi:hypothetical protein
MQHADVQFPASAAAAIATARATLVAAGIATAAIVSASATAHAVPVGDTSGAFSGPAGDQDASAYWVDVSGFVKGSVSDAANLGHTICSALESGESEGKVIADAAQGNQSNVSDDKLVVHAAEWHFCPDYY